MNNSFRLTVASVVILALSVASLIFVNSVASSHEDDANANIAELESKVSVLEEQRSQIVQDAVVEDIAGPDNSDDINSEGKVSADLSAIGDFLDIVFTWDSHESYEAARSAISADYNIAQDDNFFITFMPAGPVSTDANGKDYPYIDAAGLNSTLETFSAVPIEISDGQYKYFVTAKVGGTSSGESIQSSRSSLFLISTNSDSQLIDIQAWASLSQDRSSNSGYTG